MRNNLKNQFLLFLSLLLLMSSCDKELYEDAIYSSKNGSIKEIKFDELLKEAKFRNLLESVSNNSVLNRSTFENQNGFTIANENVKIIQTDSLISYTMLIYRDSVSDGSYFENLVIQQDIFDNQNAAIFKYTPNQIIPTGHNSFQFEGYVHKQNINFTGFNRTTNQNVTQSDCYVDQLMCSENWLNAGTSGPVHSATGSCRNINFLFVKRRQVICPDDGGSTGGGGIDDGYWSGDNNPNDGGFGNTGGGGGFDSESTIPLEYLPNTDDIVTSPIKNPYLDAPKSTPCAELNKLSTNIYMQGAIANLQTKTNLSSEFGYSVSKSDATNYNNPVACNSNAINPNQINMPVGGDIIGAFHTHPLASETEVFPMFTDGDINWLFLVAQKNSTLRNEKVYEEFFLTLTVPQGTFAIKIKDWVKFSSFRWSSEWKNKNEGRKGKLDKLNNKYDKIGHDGNFISMKNALLEIFKEFDAGIGLYEANSELNGWSELELAPTGSSYNMIEPIKKPCQ